MMIGVITNIFMQKSSLLPMLAKPGVNLDLTSRFESACTRKYHIRFYLFRYQHISDNIIKEEWGWGLLKLKMAVAAV